MVFVVFSFSVVIVRMLELQLKLMIVLLVKLRLLSYCRYREVVGWVFVLNVSFGFNIMLMVFLFGILCQLGQIYSCLLKCIGWKLFIYLCFQFLFFSCLILCVKFVLSSGWFFRIVIMLFILVLVLNRLIILVLFCRCVLFGSGLNIGVLWVF